MPAGTSSLEALIDHAASLQQQVDQLSREVTALAVAGIALALALMLMSVQLWDRQH